MPIPHSRVSEALNKRHLGLELFQLMPDLKYKVVRRNCRNIIEILKVKFL